MTNKHWGLSGPAFKTATSANSLAVINKPVRVVVSRLHSIRCASSIIKRWAWAPSGRPLSIGKNAVLISNLYTMINSSVTACDLFYFFFKKKEKKKKKKDAYSINVSIFKKCE